MIRIVRGLRVISILTIISMTDFDVVLKQFGSNVRKLRKSKHLSQEKLGEISGLDRTYIGGIERGERNLTLINIVRLAKALEVQPLQLFEGVDLT